MTLAQQIEEAEAVLDQLKRRSLSATCRDLGHKWELHGGRNCGCDDLASCSVPVYVCSRCDICDYGDNFEAQEIRAACREDE